MSVIIFFDGIKVMMNFEFECIVEVYNKCWVVICESVDFCLLKLNKVVEFLCFKCEVEFGFLVVMGCLCEVVSFGDFLLLFQLILQVLMFGQYVELLQQWLMFFVCIMVLDFCLVCMVCWDMVGGQLQMIDYNGGVECYVCVLFWILELMEYFMFNFIIEGMDYFVNKYGVCFFFLWEVFMNDEL